MEDQSPKHSADEEIAHWITQFCAATGLNWGEPPFFLCEKICKIALYSPLTDGLDQVKLCLESMFAQRKKPRYRDQDWDWFYWRIREWITEQEHAERSRNRIKGA